MTDESRSRWDRAYLEAGLVDTPFADPEPSEVLAAHRARLPESGIGLDIAGGTGKNTIWLAQRGLSMTITDISSVALRHAEDWAQDRGLQIRTVACDLEADGIPDAPSSQGWDVIVKTYYLDRAVLAALPAALAPGGFAFFVQPTETNLERHDRPSRRFLLGDGELADLVAEMQRHGPGFDVLVCSEGWRGSGAHEGWLVIRRR